MWERARSSASAAASTGSGPRAASSTRRRSVKFAKRRDSPQTYAHECHVRERACEGNGRQAVLPFEPSPLAGEGAMVSQRNREGEGFNDGTPLTPSSHVADTELPSPA